MVGKTALNKEMKHLNGAYFRTNSCPLKNNITTNKKSSHEKPDFFVFFNEPRSRSMY